MRYCKKLNVQFIQPYEKFQEIYIQFVEVILFYWLLNNALRTSGTSYQAFCILYIMIAWDIQHCDTHQGNILCVTLTQPYFGIIHYFLPHLLQTQNSCERHENTSPFVYVLPAYKAMADTYQINTSMIHTMLNFKRK
jgi:hypothetical protein